MKKSIKQLTIASTAFVGIAAITGLVAISNASAETIDTGLSNLEPIVANLTASQPLATSKDETVYAIASTDGTTSKLFVGNTLYTGNNSLPFTTQIRYYLDGTELSPAEIAGKSGHVKIVFSYDSIQTYQGKKIPFLALSGLMLDSDKFSSVTIDHGKIIDGGANYAVVGYAFPGLNADLSTNLLPDSFALEADTTDFALPVSYTVVTNEFFAELDTTKLSNADSLINSVNQLSDGLNTILTGATDLSGGLENALAGAVELKTGAEALAAGAQDALAGATALSSGLTQLTAYNDTLTSGATTVITSTLTSLNSNPTVQYILSQLQISAITVDNFSTVLPQIIAAATAAGGDTSELAQAQGLLSLSTGIIGYVTNVADVASGTADLAAGLTSLSAGATQLSAGLTTLVDGQTTLYNGSIALKDGLTTFKTSGIDKLVSFANNDLDTFIRNVRTTVTAAQSYRHFSQDSATSVKFIVKTASVK